MDRRRPELFDLCLSGGECTPADAVGAAGLLRRHVVLWLGQLGSWPTKRPGTNNTLAAALPPGGAGGDRAAEFHYGALARAGDPRGVAVSGLVDDLDQPAGDLDGRAPEARELAVLDYRGRDHDLSVRGPGIPVHR